MKKSIPHSIKNKKAFFDYEILESYDAGIVLLGEEIKSIRNGGMNFSGSYIFVKEDSLSLIGATIGRYKFSSNKNYDSKRERKLLLTKKEIEKIQLSLNNKGVTAIPLEGYFKKNLFKIKIGIGKGKKKYDKRETIKKREVTRELKQQFKY